MYKVEMENGTVLIVSATTEAEAKELVYGETGFHRYGAIKQAERLNSPVFCVVEK
jgi:hypothetical protein